MEVTLTATRIAAAWAYSLIWPLSAAGASPHMSEDLRWYIGRQQQSLEGITGLGPG